MKRNKILYTVLAVVYGFFCFWAGRTAFVKKDEERWDIQSSDKLLMVGKADHAIISVTEASNMRFIDIYSKDKAILQFQVDSLDPAAFQMKIYGGDMQKTKLFAIDISNQELKEVQR